jgi:hypothetical protein
MKKLLLLLLFSCSTAHAGVYENGNTLLRDMDGTEMAKMYALGYIVGAADAYGNMDLLCIPGTVTKGQLNDVVHISLKTNPSMRDLPADLLVLAALGVYWECEAKPKGRKKS